MINVSKMWKKLTADMQKNEIDNRQFTAKATIILNDDTVLNITESDIVINGVTFNHASTSNNKFQVGTAIIGQNGLILNNVEGLFSQYDFANAVVIPYIGLKIPAGTEYIKKGMYNTYSYNSVAGTVILENRDNMQKLEKPFSEIVLDFPVTTLHLLQKVCIHCNIALLTSSFLNDDFIINRRPDDEAITCREIVSWIAQIACNNARCNIDGALELKWYDMGAFEQEDSLDGGSFDSDTPYSTGDDADGGNFTNYNSGDSYDGGTFLQMDRYHYIYAMANETIGTDDVVITGVQVKAMGIDYDYGETVLYGTEGYVISIDDNPLIQENTAAQIAGTIGSQIVGMKFRPLQIGALNDPSREAGDVAYISDRKGNRYQTLLTNISYKIGSLERISCDAESPVRNSSTRFSESSKNIVKARNIAKREISSYDIAVQQLTNLMVNSFGTFKSEEILEDNSVIYYMHNKPTREESQTIWKMTADAFAVSTDGGITWNAGMDSEGNVLVNVLNAIGINADWINAGEINGIRITTNTGKIGPFEIGANGLFSNVMQFFEDNNYPLIWLTKKGPNGEDWGTGANGTERANYEPSVAVVRAIEDGVRTDVTLMARDDTGGTKGKLSIVKTDASDNTLISEVVLKDSGLVMANYEDSTSIEISQFGIFVNSPTGSGNVTFVDGDTYINGYSWSNTLQRIADLEARP